MIQSMNEFFQKDIISVRDFDKQKLESIFDATNKIIKLKPNDRREIGRGKTLGYLFYEPSTRTSLSFEAEIESILEKTLLNGGSGNEEPPTQGLQDLFTIKKEKNKIDGLKIGIVGDLKYGRTVYSLLSALSYYDVDVHLISPESLKIRTDSTYEIKKRFSFTESTDLEEYIDALDVVYVTRIQKERFPDEEEYIKVKGSYVIGLDIIKKMKDDAIILHPLPRLDEISAEVDNTKQAKYFKQAEYGMYTRAALLGLILNEKGF